MKLALLVSDLGSFHNFLSDLTFDLGKDFNEVHVISSHDMIIKRKGSYDFDDLNVHFHCIDFPRGLNLFKHLKANIAVNRLISSIKPDIVHLHFESVIFTGILFFRPRCITIGTFHGLGFPVSNGLKRVVFYLTELYSFSRLDHVIVLNNVDYEFVSKFFEKKAFKLNSKGLGCRLEEFNGKRFSTDDVERWRHSLGWNKKSKIFIFVGRFVDFKGFGVTVRAFLKLSSKYTDLRLLLVGGLDSLHHSGLTQEELDSIQQNENIIVIGFTDEVAKYLALSDFFVFPSVKEGIPVSVLEALAMGLPVITSSARGCLDIVENDVNGLVLSEKPSEEEVSKAMADLLKNDNMGRRMRQNILRDRDSLDRRTFVSEQISFYRSLISK